MKTLHFINVQPTAQTQLYMQHDQASFKGLLYKSKKLTVPAISRSASTEHHRLRKGPGFTAGQLVWFFFLGGVFIYCWFLHRTRRMFLWAWIKTSWTDAVPGTSPETIDSAREFGEMFKALPRSGQHFSQPEAGLPTPALTLHRGGRAWISDSLELTTWGSTSTPQPRYPRCSPPKKRDEAHLTPRSNPQHISEGWQKASGLLWPLLWQLHPWHGPTSHPAKSQAQGAVPGDPAEFLCSQAVSSGKNKPCLAAPAFCCGLPGPSHLQPSPSSSFWQPHHFAGMWKPHQPQNTTRSTAASSPAASGFPLTVTPAPAQIAAQTAAQQHVWLLQHSDKFG